MAEICSCSLTRAASYSRPRVRRESSRCFWVTAFQSMWLTMSRWTLGRQATRPLRRILRRPVGAGSGWVATRVGAAGEDRVQSAECGMSGLAAAGGESGVQTAECGRSRLEVTGGECRAPSFAKAMEGGQGADCGFGMVGSVSVGVFLFICVCFLCAPGAKGARPEGSRSLYLYMESRNRFGPSGA